MLPSLFVYSLSNSMNGAGDPAKPDSSHANGSAGHRDNHYTHQDSTVLSSYHWAPHAMKAKTVMLEAWSSFVGQASHPTGTNVFTWRRTDFSLTEHQNVKEESSFLYNLNFIFSHACAMSLGMTKSVYWLVWSTVFFRCSCQFMDILVDCNIHADVYLGQLEYHNFVKSTLLF